jgi:hypothetical protein
MRKSANGYISNVQRLCRQSSTGRGKACLIAEKSVRANPRSDRVGSHRSDPEASEMPGLSPMLAYQRHQFSIATIKATPKSP